MWNESQNMAHSQIQSLSDGLHVHTHKYLIDLLIEPSKNPLGSDWSYDRAIFCDSCRI